MEQTALNSARGSFCNRPCFIWWFWGRDRSSFNIWCLCLWLFSEAGSAVICQSAVRMAGLNQQPVPVGVRRAFCSLTLLSPLVPRRLYHLLHLRDMAQRGSHVRSHGGRGEKHGGWLGQLQMTACWPHGHLGKRCSRGGSRAGGSPKRCPRLISKAETRKRDVGIPGPAAAACSLLPSAVKKDGKGKKAAPLARSRQRRQLIRGRALPLLF